MKKIFLVALTFVLVFVGAKSVSAMTEEQLKEILTKAYVVNGVDVALTDDNKVLVERYLEKNEVSSTDAQYIADKVEEILDDMKAKNITSYDDIVEKYKDKVEAVVTDIAGHTDIQATYTNGKIKVLNDDNTTFVEDLDPDHLVKQTGSEVSTVAIIAGVAFMITLVGAGFVVRQVKFSK